VLIFQNEDAIIYELILLQADMLQNKSAIIIHWKLLFIYFSIILNIYESLIIYVKIVIAINMGISHLNHLIVLIKLCLNFSILY